MTEAQSSSVSFLRPMAAGPRTLGVAPAFLGAMLVAALLLPRFALTFGQRELSLTVVISLTSVAVLAVMGELRLDPVRVGLFCLAIACMLVSAMLGSGGRISAASFLLLVCLYSTFIFVLRDGDGHFAVTLRVFRFLAFFIAIAGICQFIGQFAIRGDTLFTFEGTLPDAILSHGFNYVIPMGIGELNKANGFFLVEPSSFSQLMALAIIVEFAFFAPSWRLGVLGLAMLLAYSGTGLILFAVFVPALLIHRGHGRLVLLSIAGAFAVIVFSDALHLTALMERANEFSSDRSSAFARFLSPFYLFNDFIFPKVQTTLFGMGPGAIEPFFNALEYEVHDPTWGKLFFEYGVVGTIPFVVFVCYCIFVRARSPWVSAAMFLNYLILGGNLVDARLQALMLVMVIFPNTNPPQPSTQTYGEFAGYEYDRI